MQKDFATIKISLKEYPQVGFGYDVEILSDQATIADYITALDQFQNSTMAPCLGCDGCCHERIPLIIGDFFFAKELVAKTCQLPLEQVQLYHWVNKFAQINQINGGLDVVLKANPNYSCIFLNQAAKACNFHPYRTFVCRTHCCLPKSNNALELRSQLVNAGEDQLVRELLNPEIFQLLSPKHQEAIANQNIEDYPQNGFSNINLWEWKTTKLKTLISTELWGKLFRT